MKKNLLVLSIVTNLIIILVAVLGSIFVGLGMDWYMILSKPSEWIPRIVFPIVWTTIYVLIAVVIFIWQRHSFVPREIYALFIVNGILNVLWCLVFFTLHQLLLGVIVIVLNLIMAFLLINKIFKNNEFYGWVLSIYPFWLCLATGLQVAVWILN